jgi:uncharacterized membrane protein
MNSRAAALVPLIAVCGGLIAIVPGTIWKVLLILVQLGIAVLLGMSLKKRD